MTRPTIKDLINYWLHEYGLQDVEQARGLAICLSADVKRLIERASKSDRRKPRKEQ